MIPLAISIRRFKGLVCVVEVDGNTFKPEMEDFISSLIYFLVNCRVGRT